MESNKDTENNSELVDFYIQKDTNKATAQSKIITTSI